MAEKFVKGAARVFGGGVIQALPPDASNSLFVAAGATSVRADLSGFTSPIIRIASVNAIYVRFGDNTVVASAGAGSMLHPAGSEIYVLPENATNVAIIQESVGGAVTITGMGDP